MRPQRVLGLGLARVAVALDALQPRPGLVLGLEGLGADHGGPRGGHRLGLGLGERAPAAPAQPAPLRRPQRVQDQDALGLGLGVAAQQEAAVGRPEGEAELELGGGEDRNG